MAGSTRVCWGGTNSASCGPRSLPPIQTCWLRQRPAVSGSVCSIKARCIARIASASIRSDSAIAAFMALVLATISLALRLPVSPSSASAMARADAVRFSIWELEADSDRRSTA